MADVLEAMPKYEAYKDLGNDWLDNIPEYWEFNKIKYYCAIYNGDSLNNKLKDRFMSDDEDDRPYISSKDIKLDTHAIDYQNGLRIPKNLSRYKVAPKNTSLICIEGGSAGKKIAFARQSVCFVNKLACIKPNNSVNSKFFFYAIQANAFQSQFNDSMSGLIGGVAISIINNFKIAIPPFSEQTSIAKFLDCKTSQIDQAIAIKEKQIALLKERKQTLINNTVTRGLDPNVPMKDSGVEWIGKIPNHWAIIRFKNLFNQSHLPPKQDDGVVTSYRDGQVTLRSNRRLEGYTEAILEGGYQGIRVGQLVLNSMDAFEGAIGVSESDGKCTPEYVICDPVSEDILPEYFAYLLREMALAKYIQVIGNAVRQRAVRIRFNNLAQLFMVVPSKHEQQTIVDSIQRESNKANNGIEHLLKQINKLKEYKSTLINSAVTGQFKVA